MAATKSTKKKCSNNGIASKPRRHYTEYNLFFQLEREYILQKIYDVKPQVKHADDLFDPLKPSYSGPSLPKRYDGIILKKDWYIPRNKKRRKHVKSHGKISFIDLSRQVAREWARAGDDVKDFCAKWCLIGAREIKCERTIKKERRRTHTINDEGETKDHDYKVLRGIVNEQRDGALSEDNCLTEEGQDDHSYEHCSWLQSSISVLFTHFGSTLVQDDFRLHVRMDDEEIRRLWLSQDQTADYRVSWNDGEGVRLHCRPSTTEVGSLESPDSSAVFIGLCYEMPPQAHTPCCETLHSVASFSTDATPNLCQLTYDSLPQTQIATMVAVSFEN